MRKNITSAQKTERSSLKYRADIDGLRAISVAAVIIFHIAPHKFPAGGIGVDIFFVISGYLIGDIVIASTGNASFSYKEFYMRRLRRIAPAFLFAILTTSVFSYLFLYPNELEIFSKSAIAALLGISNIFFYNNTSYFAPDSKLLPLLHTWTLGVEEQFYIFLPVVIGGFFSIKPRYIVTFLSTVLLLSLSISQYQIFSDSPAAFYLLPSRAWELVAGVLASQFPARIKVRPIAAGLVGGTGLILILGSLIFLRPESGYPGLFGVPPVFGAVLVLISGKQSNSMVHQMLGIAPMRIVGLASYSLYLWHWPVIVFTKLYFLRGVLTPWLAVWVVVLTCLIGFVSWRYVERPTRSAKLTDARLLRGCAVVLGIALCFQVAALISGGLPQRMPKDTLRIFSSIAHGAKEEPKAKCILNSREQSSVFDRKNCLATVNSKPNWLLVGDSHAGMLYFGLVKQIPTINVQLAVVLGCDVRFDVSADGRPCDDVMHYIFSEYVWDAPIAGVIYTARPEALRPWQIDMLGQRLKARGKKLLVLGPTPGYSLPVSRILAEMKRRNSPDLAGSAMDENIWSKDRLLRAQARSRNFEFISVLDAMCVTRVKCKIADERGMPLYLDGDHYTPRGSLLVWRRLIDTDRESGGSLSRTLE